MTEALAVFRPLHANIYLAFDYTDEGQVYDALARSVDGQLLDDLYNEIYRSLVMEEEGGAVSRIRHVEPISNRVTSIGLLEGVIAFSVEARWQVDGAVSHWGHSHSRTNEYLAEYTVVSGPEGWRIAASRVLEQTRVDDGSLPPSARGI
jgi:hypothetical protein